MPSTSKRQMRLMRAAAHDPEFAQRVHVPMSVAREFHEADQRQARKRAKRNRAQKAKVRVG